MQMPRKQVLQIIFYVPGDEFWTPSQLTQIILMQSGICKYSYGVLGLGCGIHVIYV